MFCRIALGFAVTALSATAVCAQTPPAAAPATQAQSAASPRVYASDAGMTLNFIKADRTADFEAVVAKLKEALARSTKPERKEQAKSWKVFRSSDPGPAGSVLYVFVNDPAVKGADYTVTNILAEAFPATEVTDLFKQYTAAYASGMNFVNLTLVSDLAK